MRLAWFGALADLPPVPEAILKVTALLALGWMIHAGIRRANPRWRVLLWRGAAVAILCLPLVGLLLPKLHVPIAGHGEEAALATIVQPEVTWEAPAWEGPLVGEKFPAGSVAGLPEPGAIASAGPSVVVRLVDWLGDHWLFCLAAVWGSVAGALALWAGRVSARLRRILKDSREAPSWARRLLRQVAADLQCRREVGLRSSSTVASPTLTGLFRPVVILPEGFSDPGAIEDLRAVLAHELSHWQRGDLLWTWILQALSIVFWFHPLVWRVGAAHAAACEEVCDGVAALYVGGPDAYRGTLARVALALLGHHQVLGGVPMARRPHVRIRLERLKERLWAMPLHRRALIACLLGGGLVLAGLGGLTFSSAQEPAGGNPDTVAQASGEAVSAALGSRVLHFPKDRSVGTLSIQDENATRQIEACFYWVDGTQREEIGPAIGDVAIPAGKRVQLMVSDEGSQDMSFLAALGPDDLYELGFGGSTALGARFAGADAGLKHASHLTGVRVLGLRLAPITAAGFKHLSKMQSVERIYMPMRANNSTLKPLRMFPRLKAVYLESPQITDAGLPELAALKNLEELELATDRLTGAGLRGLARLRSLQYLFLHGQDSAEAVAQLQAPPSLRILCVNVKPFGDPGMEAISRLTQLENFSAHWAEDITDRGLAYLSRLPKLRKLDVGSARMTDDGARVLGQIRTLDYLALPAIGLTDTGLAHVANLENLKYLWVAAFTGSKLTDQTLARLAKLPRLEELTIGGAFTDEGMSSLGGVQSLKALTLSCGPLMDPRVTNAGIAHLARLTKIQQMGFSNVRQCTLSGLSALKDLGDLRMLHVNDIRQDQKGMDLSGMVRLEDLIISMYGQRVGQTVVFDPMIDEDLRSLPKLASLRRIQLSHRGFTDRGLQYLSGLKNAEFINLGGPGITDAGFAAFSGLPRLNWLKITGGAVTDRALGHLESSPSLARLEIKSDRAISPQAVAALKAKLPHLTDVQISR